VRRSRSHLIYAILLVILSVGVSGGFLVSHDSPRTSFGSNPRAALVDELSATMPDPSFVSSTVAELTRAGYVVDYYGPDMATVDLYRNLPSMGYGLIIFRAHTAWSRAPGISILTSEAYNTNKYTLEQLTDQLDPDAFWRVHRSYVVNIQHIREVVPWFKSSYQLRMDDPKKTEIPVSRAQTKRLRKLFNL